MDWREFREPGGPLAFSYPETWTLRAEDALQLVSPSGSVVQWRAFRAKEDAGDDVTRTPGPTEGSRTSWQVSRKNVVVHVTYVAGGSTDDERGVVDAIVESTVPAPDLLPDAAAFVEEVHTLAVSGFPDSEVSTDGMTIRVAGHGLVDLTRAYRDVVLHPQTRDARVQQVLALLAGQEQLRHWLDDWSQAQSHVFPLLVTTAPPGRFIQPFLGDLQVAFALDFGPGMHPLATEDLDRWAAEPEAVRRHAMANLERTQPLQLRRHGESSLTVVGGHTFATGELLLPRLYVALAEHLGGTFPIVAPARNVLAAAREEDLDELITFAQITFAADAFPLSVQVLQAAADGVSLRGPGPAADD